MKSPDLMSGLTEMFYQRNYQALTGVIVAQLAAVALYSGL
jgi:hypothetical protein